MFPTRNLPDGRLSSNVSATLQLKSTLEMIDTDELMQRMAACIETALEIIDADLDADRALSSARPTAGALTRWVCPDCGTWIWSGSKPDAAKRDAIRVLAGTLDDTSWLRPTVHFWTRSAQPWVVLPEGDLRFETQPQDLAWMRTGSA